MPTLIYAPGVKVYISTAPKKDAKGKVVGGGLVDVSDDLVDGNLVRRSDGVSSFNFTLNNQRRKYDSVFTPNDRIVVVMKRLTWMRVLTGLLNSVPLVTAWPTVVPLSASCSLKRLQYWYWDAHTAATYNLITQALGASQELERGGSDGGITNVVLTILEKVVGWPTSKVHIAKIPDDWFVIAQKIAQQVDKSAEQADALSQQYRQVTGSAGVTAGATNGSLVNGKLTDGSYGGKAWAGDQCRNAEIIYSVGKSSGFSDRDISLALACAMQESKLKALDYGDRDSVGLFQQRPSQGWGTVAQCQDPTYSATKFYAELKKISSRDSMRETQAIQAVQRSGYPDAYQQWVPSAQAIVKVLGGALVGGGALSQDPAWQGAAIGSAPTGKTGQALAAAGLAFVEKYPRVMYSQGGGRDAKYLLQEPPQELDCSSFVAAMMVRVTGGSLGGMPVNSQAQSAWCARAGSKKLSVDEGLKTAGALMFGYPSSGGPGHVEISLGNGKQTVGTRHTGTPASIGNGNNWTHAYAVPGLSYPNGIGSSDGGTASTDGSAPAASQPTTTASELPGYDPNDPFDKLFGNQIWMPDGANEAATATSEALVGIRALINDQPLLPYLMNLFNSTMRSFCSAPNGDLIAWFPDYYGLWGTAAKMVVEPIEVMDFTVQWSDDAFVTHMFTMAGMPGNTTIDVGSGSIGDSSLEGVGANRWTQTLGIASIDVPAIMYALFGIDATPQQAQDFAGFIYKRFGARPNYEEMPGLQGPKAEFFSALFLFMRRWAYQYNADIPLTFMPELWPGMLIQIPAFDFQAYVTTVTHTFRFGQGGGFQTTVNIAAPARLPKSEGDRDNVLLGLPLAGDFIPGRGISNIQPVNSAEDNADLLHGGHRVPSLP